MFVFACSIKPTVLTGGKMYPFTVKDKFQMISLVVDISPSYSVCGVTELRMTGISYFLPNVGIKSTVTVKSGVKYGNICSRICVPSSVFLT